MSLNPLTSEQIENYAKRAGDEAQIVKNFLQDLEPTEGFNSAEKRAYQGFLNGWKPRTYACIVLGLSAYYKPNGGKKKASKKREAQFQCNECGRKFYSLESAECAASEGCPQCGGVDIDLA